MGEGAVPCASPARAARKRLAVNVDMATYNRSRGAPTTRASCGRGADLFDWLIQPLWRRWAPASRASQPRHADAGGGADRQARAGWRRNARIPAFLNRTFRGPGSRAHGSPAASERRCVILAAIRSTDHFPPGHADPRRRGPRIAATAWEIPRERLCCGRRSTRRVSHHRRRAVGSRTLSSLANEIAGGNPRIVGVSPPHDSVPRGARQPLFPDDPK